MTVSLLPFILFLFLLLLKISLNQSVINYLLNDNGRIHFQYLY